MKRATLIPALAVILAVAGAFTTPSDGKKTDLFYQSAPNVCSPEPDCGPGTNPCPRVIYSSVGNGQNCASPVLLPKIP